MEPILLYTSRKKSFGILLLALLMTACAGFVFLKADDFSRYDPLVVRIVGAVGVLFFGFGVFVAIARSVKNRLFLVIDGAGIDVDPPHAPRGRIPWGEIDGFSTVSIHGTKIIVIHVKNPFYWIEHEANAVRRKMMEFNVNYCGSPFNIGAGVARMSHAELLNALNAGLLKYNDEQKR